MPKERLVVICPGRGSYTRESSGYLDSFKNIANKGISILFVEQNVRLALSMADRGYVLESGHLVIDGMSKDIINSEKLKNVFLG